MVDVAAEILVVVMPLKIARIAKMVISSFFPCESNNSILKNSFFQMIGSYHCQIKHVLRPRYDNSKGPSYDLIYDLFCPTEDYPSDVYSDSPRFSLNFDIFGKVLGPYEHLQQCWLVSSWLSKWIPYSLLKMYGTAE